MVHLRYENINFLIRKNKNPKKKFTYPKVAPKITFKYKFPDFKIPIARLSLPLSLMRPAMEIVREILLLDCPRKLSTLSLRILLGVVNFRIFIFSLSFSRQLNLWTCSKFYHLVNPLKVCHYSFIITISFVVTKF